MNGKSAGILSMVSVLFGIAMIAAPAYAHGEDDDARLAAIIGEIEKGWELADGQPFREHYLDFEGARYIEGGGQNEGLEDLIEHHVEPEGDAFDDFDLSFTNTETHLEGDFAWALADFELQAVRKSNGEALHIRGYETFLFRRIAGEWKVVHTHSSSRPVE